MRVYWLTGLSGTGKTTLAEALIVRLREQGRPSLLIDGDLIRAAICDPSVGYDYQSRLVNARRIGRLAAMCAKQQLHVVVATISLFHEIHDWNRLHLPGYFEIWLRRPELRADVKPSANSGPRVGLEVPPEYPRKPHLTLDNNRGLSELRSMAMRILQEAE